MKSHQIVASLIVIVLVIVALSLYKSRKNIVTTSYITKETVETVSNPPSKPPTNELTLLEFLEEYRQWEHQSIKYQDIDGFMTNYRLNQKRWNVSDDDLEPTIKSMIGKWGLVSKWKLYRAVQHYKHHKRYNTVPD